MAKGMNGHGAMFLLGGLCEAVEFIKVGMAEQRNEVRHELAAVREDLGNLRATVEAMSRPSLKIWGHLSRISGTQWRWLGTAFFLVTGMLLRLDPVWVSAAARGFLKFARSFQIHNISRFGYFVDSGCQRLENLFI